MPKFRQTSRTCLYLLCLRFFSSSASVSYIQWRRRRSWYMEHQGWPHRIGPGMCISRGSEGFTGGEACTFRAWQVCCKWSATSLYAIQLRWTYLTSPTRALSMAIVSKHSVTYIHIPFLPSKAGVTGHLVIRRSCTAGYPRGGHVARGCGVGGERVHVKRQRLRHFVACSNSRAASSSMGASWSDPLT